MPDTSNIADFFTKDWGKKAQPPEESPAEEAVTPAETVTETPEASAGRVEALTPPNKKPAKNKDAHKKANKPEEDDTAGKEKFSIYLPPKLSMALRMEYIMTHKKFSHVVEAALTDRYEHRYQCHSPACNNMFGGFGTDEKPACCPFCGGTKFSKVKVG